MTDQNNTLQVSIPTTNAAGLGGGLSANLNFGTSTSTMASQAYQFLGASNAMADSFLANTQQQSQAYLAGNVNPIMEAAANQVQQNASLMPSLYGSIMALGTQKMTDQTAISQSIINSNAAITTSALNMESNIQQASIASINKSNQNAANSGKKKGGLCFITTAVCHFAGFEDNCWLLETLRSFRDSYMDGDDERREQIHQYYREAPGIVEKLEAMESEKRSAVYTVMYWRFLLPAAGSIAQGQMQAAHELYCKLYEFAKESAR